MSGLGPETPYTLRVSSGVTDSLVGRVLDGRYRVLSHIADGGMATVYLALDTRLDREVALKVMRPDLAHDETLRQPVPPRGALGGPAVAPQRRRRLRPGRGRRQHVPGHGVRPGPDPARGDAGRGARSPRAPPSTSWSRCCRRSPPPTGPASSTATSSPRTSSSASDGTVKVADFGLARAVTSQTTTSPDRRAARHRRLPLPRAGRARHRRRPQRRLRRRADPVRDAHRARRRSPATPRSTSPTSTSTAPCPSPSSRVPSVPAELDALVAAGHLARPRPAAGRRRRLPRPGAPDPRSTLTPTELDRRPEGASAAAGGASTVPVARTDRPPGAARARHVRRGGATAAAGSTTAAPTAPPRSAVAARPERRTTARAQRRGPWWWAIAAPAPAGCRGGGLWFFIIGPGSPTVVPVVAGKTYDAGRARADRRPPRRQARRGVRREGAQGQRHLGRPRAGQRGRGAAPT